jgi:RNA polymerase sigma-70 factor (ECF subfamily)
MKSRTYDTLVAGFQTTRWELVAKASAPQGLEREQALEELCRIYWPVIYAYIRKKGFSPVDSQDLTQDFLFHLVKGTMLDEVRSEKGRFRSYLAACCNHFLSNHRDATNTIKRGGGIQFLSLDFVSTEMGYEAGLVHGITPEKEFARRWATVLLARVMAQLEEDYAEDGKDEIFKALSPILTGERQELTYRELAVQIETTEANIQVMAHRLRRKFADLLREEIKSLADPSELEEELRYLISALS